MDFVFALIFLAGCEVLSLPLREGLAGDGAWRRVLSRLAGPVVFCLPVWILGHFIPAALSGWFLWLILFAPAAVYALWRGRQIGVLKLLGYESGGGWFGRFGLDLLCVGLFFGFVALRRHCPEMTAFPIDSSGAEKFTNAMLFWASWHAPALPPQDYWLAGHNLTYYYFGHFFWAWLGRMIAAPGELAINLALARLTVMVFESAWLLGRAVGLSAAWSAAAAMAAAWGGNIAGVIAAEPVIHASPVEWGSYSYWAARSVMPGTVNEFPAFTAILGDFHSHHMALPWLIGWLAVMIKQFRLKAGLPSAIAWVAMGAGAVLANMWNVPLMAWAIVLAAFATAGNWKKLGSLIVSAVALAIVVWIGTRLLRGGEAIPLNQGGGLPIKLVPAEIRSTFAQLMNFWGLPVIALGIAALARTIQMRSWYIPVMLLSVIDLLLAYLVSGTFLWVSVVCWGIIVGHFGRKRHDHEQMSFRAEATYLLFGILAVLIGLEVVFIDDFYSGQYERYNTYFKFSYPLWPGLIVVAAAGLSLLWKASAGWIRWTGRTCAVLIGLTAVVYPVFAFPARIIQARSGDQVSMPPTLNAVNFLSYCRAPWNAEAPLMEWIRQNVPAGDRVAEAAGAEPYSYGGRVAALAGRPITLGWTHHEVQWRGPAAQVMIQIRTDEIDMLYRGRTRDEIRAMGRRLKTRWVMFGIVEEKRYGPETLGRLREAGTVAIATRDGHYAVIDLGATHALPKGVVVDEGDKPIGG